MGNENSIKRPYIVIFVNSIPLVIIELKSPSREENDASEDYRQLKNYMKEIPSLFNYNVFCVINDQAIQKQEQLHLMKIGILNGNQLMKVMKQLKALILMFFSGESLRRRDF
jgi:type I site-specific restriction-modification system R (restriction) subunit